FEDTYAGKTFDEIEYLFAYEQLQQQKYQGEQVQKEVDLMAKIESEIEQATTLTNAVQDKTLSNNQRVKGIKGNRAFEKEKRREKEAFELGQDEPKNQSEQTEIVETHTAPSQTKSEKSKPKTKSLKSKNLELLRKMRLERSLKEE
ncbi:MAG: hypothetical protein ACRC80_34225, partial [Waterburya sp.]